jgi:tRNA(adenine34) deaminase
MEVYSDEYFMTRALDLAMQAFEEQEVPIGAVVVHNNKIIGKGYNQTEKLQDVTAHAEMLAITAAGNAVNGKYLDECTLYVTIEPCLMCAGAIQWSRFSRIVFGAGEPKFGFERIDKGMLGKTEVVGGVLSEECSEVMKRFFRDRRKKNN